MVSELNDTLLFGWFGSSMSIVLLSRSWISTVESLFQVHRSLVSLTGDEVEGSDSNSQNECVPEPILHLKKRGEIRSRFIPKAKSAKSVCTTLPSSIHCVVRLTPEHAMRLLISTYPWEQSGVKHCFRIQLRSAQFSWENAPRTDKRRTNKVRAVTAVIRRYENDHGSSFSSVTTNFLLADPSAAHGESTSVLPCSTDYASDKMIRFMSLIHRTALPFAFF